MNFAQTMPFGEAVEQTFTPGNECSICRAVSAAKQNETPQVPGPSKSTGKITLACLPPPTLIFAAPPFSPWSLSDEEIPGALRNPPPVPPPRVAV